MLGRLLTWRCGQPANEELYMLKSYANRGSLLKEREGLASTLGNSLVYRLSSLSSRHSLYTAIVYFNVDGTFPRVRIYFVACKIAYLDS